MNIEIMSALEVPQLRINAMANFDPEKLSKILLTISIIDTRICS
jgi:hypothetical protein